MKLDCGIRPEELILYTDGVLRGGRGELLEAHLRVCPLCRRWMADFKHTGRLIREATPVRDDSASRAAILARIEQEARRGRRPRTPRPLIFAVAAMALALLGALIIPAQDSEARRSIGRFFTFVERGAQRSVPVVGTPPTVVSAPTPQLLSPEGLAALPFTPTILPTLPLGLRLERGVITSESQLGLYYRNDRGLVMLLTQRPVGGVQHPRITSSGSLISIGGVEVVMQTEPRTGTVGVLTWEDAGVFYELSADEAPEGPPVIGEAEQLVEALLNGR